MTARSLALLVGLAVASGAAVYLLGGGPEDEYAPYSTTSGFLERKTPKSGSWAYCINATDLWGKQICFAEPCRPPGVRAGDMCIGGDHSRDPWPAQ